MIVGNQASDHGEHAHQSLSRYLEIRLPMSGLESGPACHLQMSGLRTSGLTKMREDLASNPLHLREVVTGAWEIEDKVVYAFCYEPLQVGDQLLVREHIDAFCIVRKILALACELRFALRRRFTLYQVDVHAD